MAIKRDALYSEFEPQDIRELRQELVERGVIEDREPVWTTGRTDERGLTDSVLPAEYISTSTPAEPILPDEWY